MDSRLARLLEALEAPELGEDPRFIDNTARMANLKALEAALSVHFRKRPSQYWLSVLDQKGLPCGPVNDMLQALSDPQTIAREMVVEVDHATAGPSRAIGLPIKFSDTPGKVRRGAPVYGEHTREVLREHGFSDDEIAAFEREGAIVAADISPRRQVA